MLLLPTLLTLAFARSTPQAAPNPAEVPFEIAGTQIVVPATIDGHELRLVFDTGYGGNAVVDTTLDLGKPAGMEPVRDFVGEFEVPYYNVKSLKLGDRKIEGNDMKVMSQPGVSAMSETTHVDGIMGLSVLGDHVTEINFEHQKFIFHPDSDDISKRKPDGKKTFLIEMEPTGFHSIELPVNTPSNKRMVMALDTGNSFYATTHRDVLERLGLWNSGTDPKYVRLDWVASGPVPSWSKDLKGMTIFGVPVPDATWDIIDLPSGDSQSVGTVGFGFLRNFNITIDFKRRYVWLENFTGKVADDPEGTCGVSAFYYKEFKGVMVARVADGSPAEKAGIKKGDQIIDIDDNDLTNITERRLRNLLEGPPGTKIKITYSRGGIATRLTLTREALVNP